MTRIGCAEGNAPERGGERWRPPVFRQHDVVDECAISCPGAPYESVRPRRHCVERPPRGRHRRCPSKIVACRSEQVRLKSPSTANRFPGVPVRRSSLRAPELAARGHGTACRQRSTVSTDSRISDALSRCISSRAPGNCYLRARVSANPSARDYEHRAHRNSTPPDCEASVLHMLARGEAELVVGEDEASCLHPIDFL